MVSELLEQSKPLTAFTTHSGKFQWNVLPFGIGIGVQTFSFVINKAIGHCSDFAESMNRLKTHPIIKTKGKVELNPESIALVEVQAPRDIIGNRKYQLNPEGYLPQGIIPLDLIHSFDKTPRMLYVPIFNTSSKYENIAKGSVRYV